MVRCNGVCENILDKYHPSCIRHTDLTGSKHREPLYNMLMSQSRRKKDNETLQQLQAWFAINNPFDVSCPELLNLSTGLVAMDDDNINCDDEESIGQAGHKDNPLWCSILQLHDKA